MGKIIAYCPSIMPNRQPPHDCRSDTLDGADLEYLVRTELARRGVSQPTLWAHRALVDGCEACGQQFALMLADAVATVKDKQHNREVMDKVWSAISAAAA